MKDSNPAQRPAPSAQRPAPSAQRLSRLDLVSKKSSFATKLRYIAGRIVPESSALYKFLYFNYVRFLSKHERPTKLVLNINLIDACNLNCRGCATFSPLVKEPDLLNLEQYEHDIKRLGELFDGETESIRLLGGEPLLHPDVVKIMEVTRRYFPKGSVGMITNGILLHKMDENFWDCCRENNIEIGVTPYPIKLNMNRIIELAKRHRVEIDCWNEGTLLITKDNFRKTTISSVPGNGKRNHKYCNYKKCQTMRGSRIYRCPNPCYVGPVNESFGEKFEVLKGDYIDISKISSKEEVLDFLGDNPIPFCRYCDVDNWKFGVPWKVSRREKSEWM